MARQRDYKAEYLRRRLSGEARGLTRQQARGHKPREHVLRAERRIAAGRMTASDEAFLDRQLARAGARGGVTAAERRRLAHEAFEAMTPEERAAIRAAQRRRAHGRAGTPNQLGLSPLAILLLAERSGPRNLAEVA